MFYIIDNKIKIFRKKSYKKIKKEKFTWNKKVKNIVLNFLFYYHIEYIKKINNRKWISDNEKIIFDYYNNDNRKIIEKYNIDNFDNIEKLLEKIFIAESEVIFPIDIFKKNNININKHNNNVEKIEIIIEEINKIIFEIRKIIKLNTNKILCMINYFIF